jgi:2',3'-cyclic-nucleotide 2'-phosphodiesterase (5'-nucleotidase family)
MRSIRLKAIALILLVVCIAGLAPFSAATVAAQNQEISILFTNDLHSNFDPVRLTMPDGRVSERGGYARMKTAIDRVLGRHPDSFILDAGDFSMGTLFQTLFASEAAELRLMGRMGFDATVLANHEFDYGARGLTDMLNTAASVGERLPIVTLANIDWEKTLADPGLAPEAQALRAAMDRYGVVQNYTIIEKGGIRAAVFGIMGLQSISYAPESGLIFKNPIEAAKDVVAQIKADGRADIIICLSHGRLHADAGRSECENLAKAVPDIDIIVSGHSHVALEAPIIHGNTIVVSSGKYTHNLGHLTLTRDGGRFRVTGYELIPMSADLPKNPDIQEAIEGFREIVNSRYLAQFGFYFDQIIAYSPFDFTSIDDFAREQGEDTLGNLIADSYIWAVARAEGAGYIPVEVAVVPNGVIRASFTRGPITVSDVFNVSSLGIGPDQVPGYPLVSIYLTGRELKTVAEIDISVSTLMAPARLYMAGLSYTYNPNRLLLNRVTDVRLVRPDGSTEKLENNRLYRVIGGLYSTQMLSEVRAQSFGLLRVTPKDANGAPITRFEDHIVYDGGRELKEWVALANFVASFPEIAGHPQIPAYYNQLQGRKVEARSWSPIVLLKSPNHIFFLLLAVLLLVLTVVIGVPWFFVHRSRRKRRSASYIRRRKLR